MLILINMLLGLVLGSFFHVIVLRLKKEEKLFDGRSKCDSCGYQLTWYDLLPVLSFCFLRGKCRKCHAKIPPSHLYAETIFALGFCIVGTLLPNSTTLHIFVMYISVVCLGMASISDHAEGMVYTPFIDVASSLILILNLYVKIDSQQYELSINYIFTLALVIGIAVALARIDAERRLGYGDYHLFILLFLCVGMKGLLVSTFLGSTIGIILYLFQKKKQRELPLAPLLYYGYLILITL